MEGKAKVKKSTIGSLKAENDHLRERISQLERPHSNASECQVLERTRDTRSVELTKSIEQCNYDIGMLMSRKKELDGALDACKDQLAANRLSHAEATAALKELLAQPQVVA